MLSHHVSPRSYWNVCIFPLICPDVSATPSSATSVADPGRLVPAPSSLVRKRPPLQMKKMQESKSERRTTEGDDDDADADVVGAIMNGESSKEETPVKCATTS